MFLGEEKMKTREDKRKVNLEFFLFQNYLYCEYIRKSALTFWCMVVPLGPHSVYT